MLALKEKLKKVGNDGFTLIELLVVIAIIAILAAIMFPVFSRARHAAQRTQCLSNMKQMGLAVRMYMDDWNDTFPLDSHASPFNDWIRGLQPYNSTKLLYRCPTDRSRNFDTPLPGFSRTRITSYGTNFFMTPLSPGGSSDSTTHGFTKMSMIRSPAEMIYISEVKEDTTIDHVHPGWWVFPNSDMNYIDPGMEIRKNAHGDGSNYVFADGHAAWMRFDQTFITDGSVNLWTPW